jgi:hypothetical protein
MAVTNGKDDFEKVLVNILSRGRLKAVSSAGIKTLHSNLSILTLHQVAEVILNLAIPITNFTSIPEKYCELWHKEIGNDIDGIRAMLEILEHAYQKVDAAFQDAKKT